MGGSEPQFAAVATRPECKYLRLLKFTAFGTSVEALAEFFASADLSRLVTLDYALHGKQLAQLVAMLTSDRLPRVRCLVLQKADLGREGAALLAESGLLSRLKSLQLYCTDIAEAGAVELARSPKVVGLEELSLCRNKIGDGGVVALANAPHLANLRTLHITFDPISEPAIYALATSTHLTRLTELHLNCIREHSKTPEAIIRSIAESENLIHLRRLRLNDDSQCSDILARLAERRRERGIE